jgi:hypothetical protein
MTGTVLYIMAIFPASNEDTEGNQPMTEMGIMRGVPEIIFQNK